MTPLLYKIPEAFISEIALGKAELIGALIKNTASGQIMAHVQPTRVLDLALSSVLQGAASTVSQGFNPLGVVAAIQNHHIKTQLVQLQSSLGVLQGLQIGTLAVSGLGLGVSVAGFAVMHKRLQGIETRLNELGDRIDRVTKDRRSDDLAAIFADIANDLDTIDTLSARRDAKRVAEAAQVSLSRSASRLQPHFARASEMREGMVVDDLDLLWSLAAAIRLCSDASFKALLHIDELAVAAELARKQSERFARLSEPLAPERLARLCAKSANGYEEMARLRLEAMIPSQTLTIGLRDSAVQTASNSSLAKHLDDHGASGRQYLEEAENETEVPLLCLRR